MTGTDKICELISNYFSKCKSEGKTFVTLKASDIEEMFDVSKQIYNAPDKKRYPAICSAMKRMMKENDEIVFSPKSGQSPLFEIKYYL